MPSYIRFIKVALLLLILPVINNKHVIIGAEELIYFNSEDVFEREYIKNIEVLLFNLGEFPLQNINVDSIRITSIPSQEKTLVYRSSRFLDKFILTIAEMPRSYNESFISSRKSFSILKGEPEYEKMFNLFNTFSENEITKKADSSMLGEDGAIVECYIQSKHRWTERKDWKSKAIAKEFISFFSAK